MRQLTRSPKRTIRLRPADVVASEEAGADSVVAEAVPVAEAEQAAEVTLIQPPSSRDLIKTGTRS